MPQNEIISYYPGSQASPIAPVAGTYTVTFGQTSAAVAFDADAATVQSALEAMSSIGAGNVIVSDIGSYSYQLEFVNDLAEQDLGPITINSSVKQAANSINVNELQTGIAGQNEIRELNFNGASSGTFDMVQGASTETVDVSLASETYIQGILDALVGSGKCVVTDMAGYYQLDYTGVWAGLDIADGAIENDTTDGSGVSLTSIQEGGGAKTIYAIELADSPTEGQFFLEEQFLAAGSTGNIDWDATASEVETAIDAILPYNVTGSSGGPWTIESIDFAQHTWAGWEQESSPLRKALDYEVVVDQEGDDGGIITGDVEMGEAVAGMVASGITGYAGTANMTQAVAPLDAAGIVPYVGTSAMEQAVAAMDVAGVVLNPVEADVAMTQAVASMDATGHVPFTGTVEMAQPAAGLAAEGYTRMDIEGAIAMLQAVAGMSATGGHQYTGVCTISQPPAMVVARGRKRDGDTARAFKHFEHRTAGI